MFGTNRLGMRVVPNNLIARGANGDLQEEMRPTMHLFYRSRIIDVEDDLTTYLKGWDRPTTTGNLTRS